MYRFVARTTLKQALAKNQNHAIFTQNSLSSFSTSHAQNIGFFEQLKEKANAKKEELVKKDEILEKIEEKVVPEVVQENVEKVLVEEAKTAPVEVAEPVLEKSRASNWRLEKLKALEEEENAAKAAVTATAVQEDVEYEQFEKEENKKTEEPTEQPKLSEQEKMAMIEEQIKLMEMEDSHKTEEPAAPILSEYETTEIDVDEINQLGHIEEESHSTQVIDEPKSVESQTPVQKFKMEVDHEAVLETEVAESNDELMASLRPTVSETNQEDINFTAPAGKIKHRGKAWKEVKKVGVRRVFRSIGRDTPTKYRIFDGIKKKPRKIIINKKANKTESILNKGKQGGKNNNQQQQQGKSESESIFLEFLQPDRTKFLNANTYSKTIKQKFSNHGKLHDVKLNRRAIKDGILHSIQIYFKNPENVHKFLENYESINLEVQGQKIEVPCRRDLSKLSEDERNFILDQRQREKLTKKIEAKVKAEEEQRRRDAEMDAELGIDGNATPGSPVDGKDIIFQKRQEDIKAQASSSFVKPKRDPEEAKVWENARKKKVFKNPVYVLPHDLIEEPSKDQNVVDYITKFENRLMYFDHPSIKVEGRITTSLKENMVSIRRVPSGQKPPAGPQHSGYYFFMQSKPESPRIVLENGKETMAGGIFKVFVSHEPKNFRRGALCKVLGAVKLSRDREQSHDTYRCSIEQAQVSMIFDKESTSEVLDEIEQVQADQEKKIEEDPELKNPEKAAKKSVKSSGLLGDDDWL